MNNQINTPTPSEGTYKAKVVEYDDFAVKREFVAEAPTKEKLFENFYEWNRTLRYCNGCYFKFFDASVKAEYDKWYQSLSEMKRFNMYYGDGIVD